MVHSATTGPLKTHVPLGTFRVTHPMRLLVDNVLTSGRLSYGPLSGQFERRFAHLHNCEFGIVSNSGTSALVVALQALKEMHGWKDGDEVLCPATTFVATINAVYHNRLKPILIDVEKRTYALDPERIERALTNRTRAIIPVHPFGQPADMLAIGEIAARKGLRVVEDSCEAMFVGIGDRRVGSFGDVGCFSTYVAHLIVTGVGGICTTNNPDLALRIRSLVNHGIETKSLPSSDSYDPTYLARTFRFVSIGHSFRITELEAALGLPQLDTYGDMLTQRRAAASYLSQSLSQFEAHIRLPEIADGREHSWMVYPIALRHTRKHVLMRYLRERGVECRDLLPLTNQPCYQFRPRLYPVSHWLNEAGLYLPCHQDLTMAQLDHIVHSIGEYFRHSSNWTAIPLEEDVNFYR